MTSQFPTLDLNLADHCWTTFDGTSLLHCPDVAKDIKICQKLGVKIFLSLGGGSGAYGLGSNAEGKSFAKVLWNTFGGGSSNRRPFDDAVVDGFDLDIEGGEFLRRVHIWSSPKDDYPPANTDSLAQAMRLATAQ